jgi:23S rRNA pseudouridine1911/1915/1917 synthase
MLNEIELIYKNDEEANIRLDVFLSLKIENISRSYIQKLIKDFSVKVNGEKVKPSYKLLPGDRIQVVFPPVRDLDLRPEEIPLDILYEDQDIIVINKRRGMVVHPGAGVSSGTIVNALLFHCRDLSGIGGVHRPGIVHRLDKGTSGVLIVAKNDSAHESLSKAFAERKILKEYDALLMGNMEWKEKTVEAPIGRHPKHRKKMAVVSNGRFARSFPASTYCPGNRQR